MNVILPVSPLTICNGLFNSTGAVDDPLPIIIGIASFLRNSSLLINLNEPTSSPAEPLIVNILFMDSTIKSLFGITVSAM